MTDYEIMIQKVVKAAVRYAYATTVPQCRTDLNVAITDLREAIKDLQDQAAISDINKIVQNLVEMRSILNGKRIEELEKRNLGKTELKFEKSESGVVCVCQKCRNILPNKIGFFKCYQYCPVCGREIERLA